MNRKLLAILFMTLIVVIFSFTQSIAQDPHYHLFADQNQLCGVPHGWNVLSNLPFIMIGLWGLWHLRHQQQHFQIIQTTEIKLQKWVAFSLILVGLGSSYYHLSPSNSGLLWDRLGMAVCFAAIISLLTYQLKWTNKIERFSLIVFIASLLSVLYWYFTEQHNVGDLRLYALVQFGGMAYIVLALMRLKSTKFKAYAWLIAGYILAKLCEFFDTEILNWITVMSGHSLKHIFAAFAVLPILRHDCVHRVPHAYTQAT